MPFRSINTFFPIKTKRISKLDHAWIYKIVHPSNRVFICMYVKCKHIEVLMRCWTLNFHPGSVNFHITYFCCKVSLWPSSLCQARGNSFALFLCVTVGGGLLFSFHSNTTEQPAEYTHRVSFSLSASPVQCSTDNKIVENSQRYLKMNCCHFNI